jgi:hypothetical protein
MGNGGLSLTFPRIPSADIGGRSVDLGVVEMSTGPSPWTFALALALAQMPITASARRGDGASRHSIVDHGQDDHGLADPAQRDVSDAADQVTVQLGSFVWRPATIAPPTMQAAPMSVQTDGISENRTTPHVAAKAT